MIGIELMNIKNLQHHFKRYLQILKIDNSVQISNVDFTPRDFEITIQTIHLIQKDYHHI